jgi:hypothetical protein
MFECCVVENHIKPLPQGGINGCGILQIQKDVAVPLESPSIS